MQPTQLSMGRTPNPTNHIKSVVQASPDSLKLMAKYGGNHRLLEIAEKLKKEQKLGKRTK